MRVRDNSKIISIYNKANPEGKVVFVLENYARFIPMINAYERGLIDDIKQERIYNRRIENGELGIKVQTSHISKPTESEGELNSIIEKAVREGDYVTALHGADNYETHKIEILILWYMRRAYNLVEGQLGALDEDLYKRYLMHEFDLLSVAESEGVTVDAIKQRFRKAKKVVIKGAAPWISKQEHYYDVFAKGA